MSHIELALINKELDYRAGYKVGPIIIEKDLYRMKTIIRSQSIPGYRGERDDIRDNKWEAVSQLVSKIDADKYHSECICGETDW